MVGDRKAERSNLVLKTTISKVLSLKLLLFFVERVKILFFVRAVPAVAIFFFFFFSLLVTAFTLNSALFFPRLFLHIKIHFRYRVIYVCHK